MPKARSEQTSKRAPGADTPPIGPQEPMPDLIEHMTVQTADVHFAGGDWAYEPKLDGYRLMAYVRPGEAVRLLTRGGLDYASYFPHIVEELAAQPVQPLVLDAEVVAFEHGKPSFSALQRRVSKRQASFRDDPAQCVLFCFDILHVAGINTRNAPYTARREMLSRSVRTGPRIQLTHVDDDGAALYHAALATGLEGVVAKRRDSRYIPGMRSPNWLKIKPFKSADFVVLGYTQTSSGLTSLLVGIPDKDGFHYAGRVSSGIGSATARNLLKSLQGAPRAVKAYSRTLTHAHWVEPSVIVEIRYFEMTSRRKLRHPVFVRVRQEIGLENLRGGSEGISDSGRVS